MFKKMFGGKAEEEEEAVPLPGGGGGGGGGGAAEPEPEPAEGGSPLSDEELLSTVCRDRTKVEKSAFDMVSVLGQGSFGQVILVRKKDTGKLYAMKVLQKRNLVARRQVEHTRSERNVLEQMAGVPFIVHVRYAFQTHDKLYLVMDFQQGGELFFHLKKLGRFNQRAVQFYAAQMVLALEAIHKLDVIYRDLVRPACPAPAETGCCFPTRH